MRTTARSFLVLIALLLAVPVAQRAEIQPTASGVVAIRGGTVLTVTRGAIQNGVVVLRNGRIEAVGGAGTAIPANA
jgi:hypothetical protein